MPNLISFLLVLPSNLLTRPSCRYNRGLIIVEINCATQIEENCSNTNLDRAYRITPTLTRFVAMMIIIAILLGRKTRETRRRRRRRRGTVIMTMNRKITIIIAVKKFQLSQRQLIINNLSPFCRSHTQRWDANFP